MPQWRDLINRLRPGQVSDSQAGVENELIDVRKLIDSFDIVEHARRADDYFADWTLDDLRLRKPFYEIDAAEMVHHFGIVLHNLRLFRHARVLDFGAGSGWLSQCLAQMGCRAIATDLSARALAIGKTYTATKHPEIADRITYLPFDGVRLDLPDGAVDRIACFDAFHHVSDQTSVLAEMHRLLSDGGRAVFCEPGPHHSIQPASQREMRAYGVIENDILIDDVWTKAENVGFDGIELSAFLFNPVQCSMEEFESLQSFETASDVLRQVYETGLGPLYRTKRLFTLTKGDQSPDSHHADGLAGEITGAIKDLGDTWRISGEAKNTGRNTWRPSGAEPGCVNIGTLVRGADGAWDPNAPRILFLNAKLAAGGAHPFQIDLPKSYVGESEIHLDLVAEHIAWFDQLGQTRVRLR